MTPHSTLCSGTGFIKKGLFGTLLTLKDKVSPSLPLPSFQLSPFLSPSCYSCAERSPVWSPDPVVG